MRVIVLGAGAVGGFVGARLALAGHEVVLVGRPWLVDAVQARGLQLIEPQNETNVRQGLRAVSSPADAAVLAPFDLVLLTVKTYDVDTAIQQMQETDLGQPMILSASTTSSTLCLLTNAMMSFLIFSSLRTSVLPDIQRSSATTSSRSTSTIPATTFVAR